MDEVHRKTNVTLQGDGYLMPNTTIFILFFSHSEVTLCDTDSFPEKSRLQKISVVTVQSSSVNGF